MVKMLPPLMSTCGLYHSLQANPTLSPSHSQRKSDSQEFVFGTIIKAPKTHIEGYSQLYCSKFYRIVPFWFRSEFVFNKFRGGSRAILLGGGLTDSFNCLFHVISFSTL